MVLLIVVLVVTGLLMRIQRHLGEVWKPGDDGPILARVGGANLPADGGVCRGGYFLLPNRE